MKRSVSILIALCLAMSLTACGGDTPPTVSDPISDPVTTTTMDTTGDATTLPQNGGLDTLRFVGRIVELVDSAVLMECVGDCVLGDTVWVQLGNLPDFVPQIGQVYTVTYEDMVMLSMPPRVNAWAMTPASASATDATTGEKTDTTATEGEAAPSTSVVTGTIATFVAADSSTNQESSATATVTAPSAAIPQSTATTQSAAISATVTTTSASLTGAPTTPPPPLEALDTAVAWDIRKAMIDMDPEIPDNYTAEDVWLTYYGTYNGYTVVSIFAPFLAADDVRWDETVGGQTFANVCAYDLYVWRDGEFLMLRAAYKNGWITDDQLRDLAYYWNGNHGKAMK